jgi:hypothetical protein
MFRALLCPSSGAFPSLHTQPLFTVCCPVRCCFQSCSGLSEVFSVRRWNRHCCAHHQEPFLHCTRSLCSPCAVHFDVASSLVQVLVMLSVYSSVHWPPSLITSYWLPDHMECDRFADLPIPSLLQKGDVHV